MTLDVARTADGPALAPADRARTVGAIALEAATRHTGPALTRPGTDPIDHAALGTAVREIAGGLADLGIEVGDHVSILAGTRPEWTLADFGALCAGATVVPIYHTNSPEECAYVLSHSGARAVICEDAGQVAKVAQIRDQCPALEHVIVVDGTAEGALTLAELRERGRAAPADLCEQRLAAVAPEDIATIVYTSGTTGPPKGCAVSHASLLATVRMYDERLGLSANPPIMYLYLPLAHSLARVASFVAVDTGGTVAFWGGDPKRIVEELAEIEPTHFPSVPRVFEKIHTTVIGGIATASPVKRAMAERSLATGARVRRRLREGRAPGRVDALRYKVADRLVLHRVRGVFGARLRCALTGAAPIGLEVLEFFDACGVLVLEGYGMTESCAAGTLNTPEEVRLGSVGRPLPGTAIAIADDGEVLIRGPHVFDGYYRNEAATAETLEDGWLRTGDLGALDEAGFLTITGRKKDLIITSSGKNISPENIESALRETRWISNAVVIGDRRSYLVALLALDPDELPALADQAGVAADPTAMAGDERVRAIIEREVDAVNARFARIEQVKRFAILPRDLTQADGELTPTLKVKRPAVHENFADEIDALYGD